MIKGTVVGRNIDCQVVYKSIHKKLKKGGSIFAEQILRCSLSGSWYNFWTVRTLTQTLQLVHVLFVAIYIFVVAYKKCICVLVSSP